MKMKRGVAWLLSFLIVFSLLMGTTKMQVFADEGSYNVDFGTGSWTVGDVTVSADKNGVRTLSETDVISLNNFDAGTMEVRVSAADGFGTTLRVTDNQTSLSARNGGGLPDGPLTFQVGAKTSDDGGNGGEGGPVTYSIDFGTGSWVVGDVTVSADKSGTQTLTETDTIALTNFNSETMEVQIVATDGFRTTLMVTDNCTSLSAKNCDGLPDSRMIFQVVSKENGDPGPGPEEPGEPPHGGYDGEKVAAEVTIAGEADFYINDSKMINSQNGKEQEVSYTYEKNGYVDFYVSWFINQKYESLTINGKDYLNQLPTEKQDLLVACKGQVYEAKITVPYNEKYEVSATRKGLEGHEMAVGNFLWSYTNPQQKDDYIDHGHMELVSVNYDGETYSPEQLNNPGSAFDWSESAKGGSAVLPAGAVVTVRLVPDYGYQLTAFGINGGEFDSHDEQSTFTFVIKGGNFHLGAHFTEVKDKVASTSNAVASGSIQLGENEIDTGSVVLSVGDADLTDEQKTAFSNAGDGNYEVSTYLDINLNQVLYKGTTDEDDVWTTPLGKADKLQSPAKVTLKLDEGMDGNNVVILHETHGGDYEVIEATYDAENHTITFITDSFSNYAIAVKGCNHSIVVDKAVEATCTETGLTEGTHCSVCEEVLVAQKEIPAKGHQLAAKSQEPTLDQDGYKTYYECERCQKAFTDAQGKNEITDLTAWKTGEGRIPSLGEQFEVYKKDGQVKADSKKQAGDSATVTKLIETAKAAINALSYDSSKNLDGNKKNVDDILNKMAKDIAAQKITEAGFIPNEIEEKPTTGDVVNITSEVKDNSLNASLSNIPAGAITLTEEESENGAYVWLELNTVNDDSATAAAFEGKLSGYSVGAYMEIDLFKMTMDGDVTTITDTNSAVSVTVTVPDSLLNKDKDILRTFYIARNHNGNVEILGASYDANNKTLTFKTDKFSDYAIIYKDAQKNITVADNPTNVDKTVPKTGDNSNQLLWITLLMISAMCVFGICIRGKRRTQ